MWTLPPRTDWNGALTEVRLFYRNGLEKYAENSTNYPLKNIKVPIRNGTTTGRTILTGLSPNQTYWIEMVACNIEGCSHPGNAFKVSPAKLVLSGTEHEDQSDAMPVNKAIILIVTIAAVLLTVYLIYLSYSCVKTRRQMPPKIRLTLHEPTGYTVVLDNAKAE
jgi:hypothetical protein